MSAIVNKEVGIQKPAVKEARSNTPSLEVVEQNNAAPAIKFSYVELSSQEIDRRILDISAKGSKLRKLIQETLVGTLIHFVNHGDYTKLVPLRKAVGESLGRNMQNAIVEFVEFTSPLRWVANEKTEYNGDMLPGKFVKVKGATNSFCHMTSADFEVAKIETFEHKGMKFRPFYDLERVAEMPKPVTFAQKIADLVNLGLRLKAEKTEGKKVTVKGVEKTVKVKHNIDEKELSDLTEFAVKHGVSIVEGKAVAATHAAPGAKQ